MVGYQPDTVTQTELSTSEYSEAGLLSGIVTRLIIQPLDVLKIRFQLQEEPIGGKSSGKYRGLIQSIRLIAHEEGYRAFWKGHVPAQGLSAIYGLVQFSSFEWLSRQAGARLPQHWESVRSSSDFVCGSLAGCFAMTAAMPLDVIRTRLVAQGSGGHVYRGTFHAIKYIWYKEGVAGYFRGWTPSVIQIAPFTGLQFAMYNFFLKLWNKFNKNHETSGALVAGASAGLLVSSQALCFTASKLFFGVASDRVSPLKLLFMGLAGVATTMIGLAYVGSFPQLLLCSLFLGSLQGAGWLPSTRLVAKWFKGGSFATMYSLLGCGSTIAGLLLPATKELYWRTVALCLGCTGTMFCILSYFSLRDNTRQPVVPKTASQQESSIRLILSSKVLWAISLSYIFTLEIRTVCEAWMPVFLNEMNMSAASYIVIYEIGGLLGTLSSGAILNVLATRLPMEKARYRFAIFCSASMLTSIMVSTSFPDYFYFLGFLSGYFVNASLNLWGMIYTQAGEEHLAGSCSAFISFIASLGSVLAGSPLAFLVSNFGYSCFIPFFAVQLVVLAGITSLQLPLRMSEEKKHV